MGVARGVGSSPRSYLPHGANLDLRCIWFRRQVHDFRSPRPRGRRLVPGHQKGQETRGVRVNRINVDLLYHFADFEDMGGAGRQDGAVGGGRVGVTLGGRVGGPLGGGWLGVA